MCTFRHKHQTNGNLKIDKLSEWKYFGEANIFLAREHMWYLFVASNVIKVMEKIWALCHGLEK